VAGFEVMINNPAISNLIRKNETNKIQSTLQTSRRLGMMTLDDNLLELVTAGKIAPRTALDYAQSPKELEARL
jgi:twitching motility protein PilT